MQIFKNAHVYNPATCTWDMSSFSVENGNVVSIYSDSTVQLSGATVIDLHGLRVIPGLIDSHVHIESSMLVPHEFGRVSIQHGVTTVVADPHEIANVAGITGIDFMLEDAKLSPMDIFFMVPSCVPATPIDVGGAVITAEDLRKYIGNPAVLGLGEMMNLPGVINEDSEVIKKLSLFSHVDGHAPGVIGETLQRYVAHGIRTDHETVSVEEGVEKIKAGLYLFIRGGDAANSLKELAKLVTPVTASRCAFCTDDRHLSSLFRDGSIDNCIRESVAAGMPLELALRLATLSAAECFGLHDRGILAPGKIADFCVLRDSQEFYVEDVYKGGIKYVNSPISVSKNTLPSPTFVCKIPTNEDLRIPGSDVRVIRVTPGSLVTEALHLPQKDLAKIVCIDRYRGEGFGVGLISGLNIKKGAIAVSIAHDTHNIIAAGVNDDDLLVAITSVRDAKGGRAVVIDGKAYVVPLPVGGIMTDKPYEEAFKELEETKLAEILQETGAGPTVFMSLSFMALTVIPHLKITPRGYFDGDAFCDVPLTW